MSNHKELRKQIRNVLQEVGKEVVTSEVGEAVEKKLLESMNARLDHIDKYCQQSLERQDKRARAIQSFLLQEVQGKIQSDLFNANCTVEAVVEVLAESGINIPDFNAKIDAKKVEIAERKKKEADEAMRKANEEHAAKAKARAEAKAQSEAVQESQTAEQPAT